jgi:hypothetical protein
VLQGQHFNLISIVSCKSLRAFCRR